VGITNELSLVLNYVNLLPTFHPSLLLSLSPSLRASLPQVSRFSGQPCFSPPHVELFVFSILVILGIVFPLPIFFLAITCKYFKVCVSSVPNASADRRSTPLSNVPSSRPDSLSSPLSLRLLPPLPTAHNASE